jgi:hypothetical protein
LLINLNQSLILKPKAKLQRELMLLIVPSLAPKLLLEPELLNPRTLLQNKLVKAKVAFNSEPKDLEIRQFSPKLQRSS